MALTFLAVFASRWPGPSACGQAMFTSVWASSSHRSQNSAVDRDRAGNDSQTVNINHTLMNVLKSSGHGRCSSTLLVYFSSALLIIFSGLSLQTDAERMCKICVDACHALIPGIQLLCVFVKQWKGWDRERKERDRRKDNVLFEC